ncbi:MAG: sigma-70 family RNA polymerase sigma factor [bacterium]|nr:sigma-70 family RNA polymerase sigma factor [bacterium]
MNTIQLEKAGRTRRLARLIARTRSENPRHRQRAAAALVRLHQAGARAYARAILKDADLAEDAVQEAWLEGFRNLKTLREPGAFGFWFRRLVFKQCDRIRRRSDFGEVPGLPEDLEVAAAAAAGRDSWLYNWRAAGDPARIVADRIETRELRKRLLAAYRGLAPADRRLVRLRFIEERPLKEIARELKITTDTIKNRIRILRRDLRPTIQSDAAYELPAHFRALASERLAGVYIAPDYRLRRKRDAKAKRELEVPANLPGAPVVNPGASPQTPATQKARRGSAMDLRCRSIA